MKKLIALFLAILMVCSLVACGGAEGKTDAPAAPAADGKAAPKSFKVGYFDTGSWDEIYGPAQIQLESAVEGLGGEIIYATKASSSADDVLGAVQNLISAGADVCVFDQTVLSILQQVADMCDEAGVYWGTIWSLYTEEQMEISKNSEYFLGTFYENDVDYSYECVSYLGKMGCKNICLIGTPAGADISNYRAEGLNKALEEYGMTLLAEERDYTLTGTGEGGAQIVERFMAAYPEMDGLAILGRTHTCLGGVVSAIDVAGKTEDIPIVAMNCNSDQLEYFEKGQIDVIMGGHHLAPAYLCILYANMINGTPLTDEPVYMEDNFIVIDSVEDARAYDVAIRKDSAYYADEIAQCLQLNNPDFDFEAFKKFVKSYTVDDVIARHNVDVSGASK